MASAPCPLVVFPLCVCVLIPSSSKDASPVGSLQPRHYTSITSFEALAPQTATFCGSGAQGFHAQIWGWGHMKPTVPTLKGLTRTVEDSGQHRTFPQVWREPAPLGRARRAAAWAGDSAPRSSVPIDGPVGGGTQAMAGRPRGRSPHCPLNRDSIVWRRFHKMPTSKTPLIYLLPSSSPRG